MPDTETRRKFRRYAVQWNAAVVFEGDEKKPVLLTRTEDLSAGGAALRSSYEDLTGSMVTLLLDRSGTGDNTPPKLLRIRARVVSTNRVGGKEQYRHGLGFLRSNNDGLDVIDRLIAESGAAETKDRRRIAREKREAEQAAAHAAAEALAAQARREAHWLETQRERISAALERAHRYLDEFVARLNRERPVYAATYSVIGVRQFSGLKWEGGIVEVRKREVAAETWHYERVSLAFSLASENKLRVTRDRASSERLRKALLDRHIEFTAYDDRGARGEAGWKTFVLSCKVLAGLQLVGDFDRGEIQLHTRNIEEFGELQYILQPEDLDSDSLRELTDRILGQPRN